MRGELKELMSEREVRVGNTDLLQTKGKDLFFF